MRFSRSTTALVAAFTLAGSVGAAPRKPQAPVSSAPNQELLDRLARAELLAGLTEVTGPGLIVTLRPCPRPPKGADPKDVVVRDQDLNGVLNALRAAGAEALAVSGARQTDAERILVTSVAKAQDGGMWINGTKLLPPYRILAVGSGDAMRTELFRPDGVVKKNFLDSLQMIELENANKLIIPAGRKSVEPKYARAAEPAGTEPAATQSPKPEGAPAASPGLSNRRAPRRHPRHHLESRCSPCP